MFCRQNFRDRAIHLRKLAVSHADNHLFHLPSFLTVSYLSRCTRDDQPIPDGSWTLPTTFASIDLKSDRLVSIQVVRDEDMRVAVIAIYLAGCGSIKLLPGLTQPEIVPFRPRLMYFERLCHRGVPV